MSTKRIILISGFARSGKDTLANALLEEFAKANKEATLTKFAIALKRALQLALNDVGLGHIDVFTEDTAEKALLRPLLVEFGKYCRAKDKDVFVNRTLKDVEAMLQLGKDVVLISDCRYLNEAQLVRAFGLLNLITVERFHIKRMGNEAANKEEADSIADLEAHDTPTFTSRNIFSEGNVDAIHGWARRLVAVRTFNDGHHHVMPEGQNATISPRGGFLDPKKPLPYLPKDWNEEISALDATLDNLSQRVDRYEDKVERLQQIIGKMGERMDALEIRVEHRTSGLLLALESFDARLKRLEATEAKPIRWTLKFSGTLKREGNLTTGTEYDLKHWPGYLEISDLQGYLIATITWDDTGYAGEPPIKRRARLDVIDLGKGEAMPTLLFSFVNEEVAR